MITITKERKTAISYILRATWVVVLIFVRDKIWITTASIVVLAVYAIDTLVLYRSLPSETEKKSYLLNVLLYLGFAALVGIFLFKAIGK